MTVAVITHHGSGRPDHLLSALSALGASIVEIREQPDFVFSRRHWAERMLQIWPRFLFGLRLRSKNSVQRRIASWIFFLVSEIVDGMVRPRKFTHSRWIEQQLSRKHREAWGCLGSKRGETLLVLESDAGVAPDDIHPLAGLFRTNENILQESLVFLADGFTTSELGVSLRPHPTIPGFYSSTPASSNTTCAYALNWSTADRLIHESEQVPIYVGADWRLSAFAQNLGLTTWHSNPPLISHGSRRTGGVSSIR